MDRKLEEMQKLHDRCLKSSCMTCPPKQRQYCRTHELPMQWDMEAIRRRHAKES